LIPYPAGLNASIIATGKLATSSPNQRRPRIDLIGDPRQHRRDDAVARRVQRPQRRISGPLVSGAPDRERVHGR
jgi:hypothetical protein